MNLTAQSKAGVEAATPRLAHEPESTSAFAFGGVMDSKSKDPFDDCKPFPWEQIRKRPEPPRRETAAERERRQDAEQCAVHAERMAQLTGLVGK